MILRSLLFRPYGKSLLSASTGLWLAVMWIMVVLTAIAEGWVAFSIAKLCGAASAGAMVLAVLVGITIYLLDMMLVLLDVAPQPGGTWLRRHWKLAYNIVIRIMICAFTVYITLPAATVSFLKDEVENEHREAWGQKVDEAQKRELASLEAELTKARADRDWLRELWYTETSGRSHKHTSGVPGVGKHAAKIERDQKPAEERVTRAEWALRDFSSRMAKADLAERSRALSVAKPELTLGERYRILDAIRERPEVRQKTRLPEAYLGLLIGGLLLMKVLAPIGVRVYLDERLQQASVRASDGGYNHLHALDNTGCAPQELQPIEFRDWFERELPKLQRMYAALHEQSEVSKAILGFEPRLNELRSRVDEARSGEVDAVRAAGEAQARSTALSMRLKSRQARCEGLVGRRLEMQARFDESPSEELSYAIARATERIEAFETEIETISSELELSKNEANVRADEAGRQREERTKFELVYLEALQQLLALHGVQNATAARAVANDNRDGPEDTGIRRKESRREPEQRSESVRSARD